LDNFFRGVWRLKRERFDFKIEREKGRKDELNPLFYQTRGVFVLKKNALSKKEENFGVSRRRKRRRRNEGKSSIIP